MKKSQSEIYLKHHNKLKPLKSPAIEGSPPPILSTVSSKTLHSAKKTVGLNTPNKPLISPEQSSSLLKKKSIEAIPEVQKSRYFSHREGRKFKQIMASALKDYLSPECTRLMHNLKAANLNYSNQRLMLENSPDRTMPDSRKPSVQESTSSLKNSLCLPSINIVENQRGTNKPREIVRSEDAGSQKRCKLCGHQMSQFPQGSSVSSQRAGSNKVKRYLRKVARQPVRESLSNTNRNSIEPLDGFDNKNLEELYEIANSESRQKTYETVDTPKSNLEDFISGQILKKMRKEPLPGCSLINDPGQYIEKIVEDDLKQNPGELKKYWQRSQENREANQTYKLNFQKYVRVQKLIRENRNAFEENLEKAYDLCGTVIDEFFLRKIQQKKQALEELDPEATHSPPPVSRPKDAFKHENASLIFKTIYEIIQEFSLQKKSTAVLLLKLIRRYLQMIENAWLSVVDRVLQETSRIKKE